MAPKTGKEIKVDENFIRGVRDNLLAVRNQVSAVRGGVNPNDAAHPRGMSLVSVKIKSGSTNFQSGQELAGQVTKIGGQLDQKLATVDTKLDTYAQNLDHILASADHVELANISLSDFSGYFGGGGAGKLPA